MDDVEVFEGPGFRMERHGRFIYTETNRTPEEQEELVGRIANSAVPIRTGLIAAVEGLQTRLANHDTFTVLAALSLVNHLIDPETYQENTHKGESVVAEYAALLALKTNYSQGKELYATSAFLEELQVDLKDAFEASAWLRAAVDTEKAVQLGRGSEAPSELEKLQFMMRMHEMGVRNPAYEHHHHAVLTGLFSPFEAALDSAIGFSVADAIRLSDVISRRMYHRLYERFQSVREDVRELEDAVTRFRKRRSKFKKSESLPTISMDVVRRLAAMSPKAAKHTLGGITVEWALSSAADLCCFTVDELAKEGNVDLERTRAYLDAFQISFGDVPADFVEFSPTHPLRSRPIIHHEGRMLSPAPMLLDWAIQPRLEAALKGVGGSVWQRYQKHRHDWLLHTSLHLLRQMMPSAVFDANLLYHKGSNRADEAELDALGCYDTTAFLIEAKGADVTEPARRGAPERLKRDLNKVIRDSHAQAVRGKKFLLDDSQARFQRVDGGDDVVINREDITEIVLLSVSLAPLGHLTALLHADSELEFFRNGEYSWVVSIYDLMVMAEIIDLPPMFPHYLRRRVHAARMGVLEAHDELDLFGYYLAEGLYVDDIVAEMRAASGDRDVSINLLSYTNPIDAYMFYKLGVRKTPAPRPSQRIPPKLKSVLERLELSGLPSRLEVSLGVLDLDEESRRAFSQSIERARYVARHKRRMSNCTLVGGKEKPWGLTYACGADADELKRTLVGYCERKCQELGTSTWLGFAELIGRQPAVVAVAVIHETPVPKRNTQ